MRDKYCPLFVTKRNNIFQFIEQLAACITSHNLHNIRHTVSQMKRSSQDPRIARAKVSGYNKPKRTPSHPTKSHVVVAKEGDQVRTIRFGQQNVKTNQTVGQRQAFKSRHAKNIAKGKMSAAWWSDKIKWSPSKTKSSSTKWKKGS